MRTIKKEPFPAWAPVALLSVLAAALACSALFRFVDGDEGYIALAGKLVAQGAVPYRDFFFPQMPYLAWIYGLWMKITGYYWSSARSLPWALTCLLCALIYVNVFRTTKSRGAGMLAALFFGTSGLTLAWYPVAKAYAPAGLMLFAAYTALLANRPGRMRNVVAGLCLGLAAGTRLYCIGLLPVLLLYAAAREKTGPRRLDASASLLVGTAAGLLPCLPFWILDPDAFLFNNLGYHALRWEAGLIGDWGQKVDIVLKAFFLRPPESFASLQLLILLALNVYAWTVRARRVGPRFLALALSVSVMGLSFLPTPCYFQYLSLAVPFLVVGAFCVAPAWRTFPSLLLILILIYVAAGFAELYRYTVSGRGMHIILGPRDRINWRISTIREVGCTMDRLAGGKPLSVISWWPGYFLESSVRVFPGMENQFRLYFAHRLSCERAGSYRLIREAEVEKAIAARKSGMVVLGNWMREPLSPPRQNYRNLLSDAGYSLAARVHSAELYILH